MLIILLISTLFGFQYNLRNINSNNCIPKAYKTSASFPNAEIIRVHSLNKKSKVIKTEVSYSRRISTLLSKFIGGIPMKIPVDVNTTWRSLAFWAARDHSFNSNLCHLFFYFKSRHRGACSKPWSYLKGVVSGIAEKVSLKNGFLLYSVFKGRKSQQVRINEDHLSRGPH